VSFNQLKGVKEKRMKSRTGKVLGLALLVAVVFAVSLALALADPPAAPKVSEIAQAEDIEAQIERYVDQTDEAIKDWANDKAKVAKCSNTLVLLALAAGLDDQGNKYKGAAPALIKAAQELAKAKEQAAAKDGLAAVKKAMEATGGVTSSLKWGKAADLEELMKQVPLVHGRLKRNLKGDKFKSKAKDNAGDAATLAIIAQGSLADTSAAKKNEDTPKWYGFCAQMRDAAAALNKAVHAKDQEAADTALSKLNQSCEDCHAVFKQ
jgi:hypothetical protein